jgi:hypothetical protein
MLEWKPRLLFLLVAVAAVALQLGGLFSPFNFSW